MRAKSSILENGLGPIAAESRARRRRKGRDKVSSLSVPFRLNLLNSLVLLSGMLSVFGAYEIQLGSTLHNLNYLHQKHVHILNQQVSAYKSGTVPLERMQAVVLDIRKQPMACLEVVNVIDRMVMRLLGTQRALELCREDIDLANRTLTMLENHAQMNGVNGVDGADRTDGDRLAIVRVLEETIDGFSANSEEFEPLVDRTVSSVFLIVLGMVIAKGLAVPFFGLVVSSGISRDYRDLAMTRRRLIRERRRNEVIQAEKMTSLSTMVAGVAHEINTPVGVCLTAASHVREQTLQTRGAYEAETLTEEGLTAYFQETVEGLEIIQNNLTRTSELVKSFKQVSVDQTMDEKRPVILKEYVYDILTSLRPITKKSPVHIEVDCPHGLIVEIYPGTLSQIITNLVTNALLHAYPPGTGGQIRIRFEIQAQGRLTLRFADDGAGIPKDIKDKIFDPFVTTKRGQGGTGLGLHILHNLVTGNLDGTVTCDSTPGAGTEFIIRFPCETISQLDRKSTSERTVS